LENVGGLEGCHIFVFQAANSDQPGNVQSKMLLRGNSGHLSTAATLMHEWTVSLLGVPGGIASFVHQELQRVLILNFDKDHENCATASSIGLYHVTLLMPKLSKMAADSWN